MMEAEVKAMSPQVKECRQPLEAGKGKEMDSLSYTLQQGKQPCQYLDFSPVGPILDFWPPEL